MHKASFALPNLASIILILFLGHLFSSIADAALTVQVLGQTNTQAILAYTAPDSNACSVQVSESSSLSPLVHDVDTTLFTNSNLDSRAGTVRYGLNRSFIVGLRQAQKATDNKFYSRALQSYTTHYYKVTCGSQSASGQFTTANIPTGNTYSDVIPVDPNNPGSYAWPTVSATDRSEQIIDPQSGALIRHLSLPEDGANSGLNAAGSSDYCSSNPMTDSNGNLGYRCMFSNVLYFINIKTGAATVNGLAQATYKEGPFGHGPAVCNSWSSFDPSNANIFYCFLLQYEASGGAGSYRSYTIFRVEYFGHNESGSATTPITDCDLGGQPCLKWTELTPGATGYEFHTMARNFDPSYATFPWQYVNFPGQQNGNLIFEMQSGNQNTPGWNLIFHPDPQGRPAGTPGSTTAVIGSAPSFRTAPARWGGWHSTDIVGDVDWLQTSMNDLPYVSHVVDASNTNSPQACPTNSFGISGVNCNTVKVDGEPLDPGQSAPNNFLQATTPGDYLEVMPNTYWTREVVRLLQKKVNVDGTQNWTVARAQSYVASVGSLSGRSLRPKCQPRDFQIENACYYFWDYKNDPYGRNASGTTVLADINNIGTHSVYRPNAKIEAGYVVRNGKIPDVINATKYSISEPPFAGVPGVEPNVVESHPSQPIANQYFTDARPFNGGTSNDHGPSSDGTNVGSGIYKFSADQLKLHRKLLPTVAMVGKYVLKDISAPGSNISAAPDHTYCIANVAGECMAGSLTGDGYVKSSNATTFHCVYPGVAVNSWSLNDICLMDNSMTLNQLMQLGIGQADSIGKYTRAISHGLSQYRAENVFWTAHSLPLAPDGGSWIYWAHANNPNLGALAGQIMLTKMPPFPGGDTVGRNDLIQLAVNVPKPAISGAVSARVQFGYAENGPVESFYCTSRQESCFKGTQSGNNFGFASESVSPVACTNGCTINIPTIPAHTVYLNVQYLNSSGSVVGTTETQVAAIEPPFHIVNFSDRVAPSAPSALRTEGQ